MYGGILMQRTISAVIIVAELFIFTAFGGSDPGNSSPAEGGRETCTHVLSPSADGTETCGTDTVTIDTSGKSDGYIMVRYTGAASRVKLQITAPDCETIFTYTIKNDSYQTFPVSAGSGTYKIDVLENTTGSLYALLYSTTAEISLNDEFGPFLYPNLYVWFTEDSEAVSLARKLSEESSDDIGFVGKVYEYVINNIEYDTAKASNISKDYIPDIDETLDTGKGICFDFASLMTSMLRSQNIPSKLVVGYSGQAYHAWISVYLSEQGWVDNIIEFDGKSWSLMDPTLASSNDRKSVQKYIGDGSNYTVKYYY